MCCRKRRDTYEAYGEDEEGNQRLLKDKQTLKQRKLIAEKLAHVCAQLGEINPAIRWQHGAEEQERHRSRFEHKEAADPLNRRKRMHTARTCKAIAEELHKNLSRYNQDPEELLAARERHQWHADATRFERPGHTCVLILDRTVDPLAPLLHDGTSLPRPDKHTWL